MNTKDKISKEVLKKLANSVTVITCQKDEKKDATTVAWVTRVSNDPPLIMVSISPRRYIHDIIVQAKEFNIAVLGEKSEEMALFCGTKSAYEVDKLDGGNMETINPSLIGSPLIKDALANLECKLVKSFDVGDHTAFIGEVVMTHHQYEGKPLIVTDKLCTLDY